MAARHLLALALGASVAVASALSASVPYVSAGTAELEEIRHIKLGADLPAVRVTFGELLRLVHMGTNFIDVTDTPDLENGAVPAMNLAYPSGPTHQNEVQGFIEQIDIGQVQGNLLELTSFFTRYYKSETGVQSADFVFELVQNVTAGRSDISVRQFAHAGFDQKSCIAHIEGTDPSLPLVIIGSHQDSINSANPTTGRSPGADDDGSGTVTLIETLRILSASGFRPLHSVEFQWYAAEEVGLVGSAGIANAYKTEEVAVYGMFQLDMTGYTDGSSPVKVLADFVDEPLSTFVKTLVDEYTGFERRDHQCGYGCSDHASWNRAGYPSSSVFEPITNPRIHQTADDLDLVNWEQAQQFINLGIAFVVELSHGV